MVATRFNQFEIDEKVQCWHDRDKYKYTSVPKQLLGGENGPGRHCQSTLPLAVIP
jgi:hypothetical protein